MVAKATRPAAFSGIRRFGRKLAFEALGGATGILQTFSGAQVRGAMPLL